MDAKENLESKLCCEPALVPPPEVPHRSAWAEAAKGSAWCPLGCNLGDIPTMAVLTGYASFHPMAAMPFAMAAGIGTSILMEASFLRKHVPSWAEAFTAAAKMSLYAMLAMELTENMADYLMGGQNYALLSWQYWAMWAPAAGAGYLAALPLVYQRVKKGQACH